ncbi:MAG: PIG-L deacetylase family protein [Terriglobales bacterium]|jgi:LmbE family N-acetylglucosaminyl deacetylase|nr:PIG-L family deacetylase [Terriglobales bacterium]
MLRMMVVTAHPDDEASSFGGSLRLYRDRGVETCVICLTPGQAATHRGSARNDQELAAIRRDEFAAACKLLDVSRAIVLDYPDGQLHRLEMQRVVSNLVLQLREFRPQVLLTFDPAGSVTGHTDHSMASIFATLAFHWAGRNNRFPDQLNGSLAPHRAQKLYYSAADFVLPGRQPVTLPPITATIEIGDYLQTKITAFRAHTSQQPLWSLFEEYARKRGQRELFHLVASVKVEEARPETDLFAGISETM